MAEDPLDLAGSAVIFDGFSATSRGHEPGAGRDGGRDENGRRDGRRDGAGREGRGAGREERGAGREERGAGREERGARGEELAAVGGDRDGLDDRIIGADGGLRPVMERVAQVARSTAPVLILGETGSGKEVIARAIHLQSLRADGPFIRVNCGAVASELIDSELFGHERGSFTGAMASRRGWFEQAHGGTLFLDEIGELSPAAQVRLLRVLQDGILQRVGGENRLQVDVRVVAATHRDLAEMVRAGRFREDLWYRVAVFPIALPPLREHREDIPAMAAHFARRAAARFGVAARPPSERDLALLRRYEWPGNVRELAAVIDRAVLLGESGHLDVERALGLAAVHAAAIAPGFDSSGVPEGSVGAPAGWTSGRLGSGDGRLDAGGWSVGVVPTPADIEPLEVIVRRHIERALAATSGRIEGPHGAARVLGINPHTLRARMRKLGIEWSRFRSP
jgi:transcriptional regulator with GAF, ATPase, and Fis domain